MDQHSISLHFVKFILRSPSGLFILSMSNEMWNLLELFLQAFILLYLFIRSENVQRMSVLSGLIFPEANLILFFYLNGCLTHCFLNRWKSFPLWFDYF